MSSRPAFGIAGAAVNAESVDLLHPDAKTTARTKHLNLTILRKSRVIKGATRQAAPPNSLTAQNVAESMPAVVSFSEKKFSYFAYVQEA
jgi:hypothetical protein